MAYDPSYNIFTNTRPTGQTTGGTTVGGGSTNPFIRNGGLSAGMVDPNWLRQQAALSQPTGVYNPYASGQPQAPVAPTPMPAPQQNPVVPPSVQALTPQPAPVAPQSSSSTSTTTTTETIPQPGGGAPSMPPSVGALNKVAEPAPVDPSVQGLGLSLGALSSGGAMGNQEAPNADASQLGMLRPMAQRMPSVEALVLGRKAY